MNAKCLNYFLGTSKGLFIRRLVGRLGEEDSVLFEVCISSKSGQKIEHFILKYFGFYYNFLFFLIFDNMSKSSFV